MKIAIIGDSGLLGQGLVRTLGPGNRLFGVSAPSPSKPLPRAGYEHAEMDLLTSSFEFFKAMDRFGPELMINAVACVDIQKCERDPDHATRINGSLPGELSRYAARKKTGFIHVSTDAVFDGVGSKPYSEEDSPCPLNQYGRSKLEGEWQVLASDPDALVCRTNIVGFRGWDGAPTFAEWLCDVLYHQKPATLVDDFVTSSMHADELGPLAVRIFQKGGKGIFHIASRDAASKYEFGAALARELGVGMTKISKGSLKDLGLKPPRAPFIALDVNRAEKFLGQKLPDLGQTVCQLARDFKHQLKESLHG